MSTNLHCQKQITGFWTGKGVWGEAEGYKKKHFGIRDLSIILIVVMVSWMYTYFETCQILHFKYVQFMVCQLHKKYTTIRHLWKKVTQHYWFYLISCVPSNLNGFLCKQQSKGIEFPVIEQGLELDIGAKSYPWPRPHGLVS